MFKFIATLVAALLVLGSCAEIVVPITDVAETPALAPDPGDYEIAQSVTISSPTAGVSIRYTLDGSTPTGSYGAEYTGIPIYVSSTALVKAVAYGAGYLDSEVAEGSYAIEGRVATPVMTPGAGTYADPQIVVITSVTVGASIRYTTDGSTPTSSNGSIYAGSVPVDGSLTMKAIAYLAGWIDSAVVSSAYVIPGKVSTPVATPAAGTYSVAQLVRINTVTNGATIRYTLDGTLPSATYGTIYTDPVEVSNTKTLRAIAYNDQWLNSSILTAAYGIALDSSGSVGQYTSLAMDAGTMFVAYYDASNKNLKRAFSTDGGENWPVESIDVLGDVGQYASVAMVGSLLYVSYYDSATLDLRFARSLDGGATWSRMVVDSTGDVGRYTSIAVDDVDSSIVAVSYYDLTNKNLKVARSVDSGVNWATTALDAARDVGEYTSIAALGGNLYVAYYDATITNLDLRFVRYDSTLGWQAPVTVDGAGVDMGKYASIAVDPTLGTIWVAYYDVTGGDLEVASSPDGLVFTPELVVDTQGNTGLHTSIALSGGKVYVSYFENLNYNLKLAIYDDIALTWSTQIVDANGVGENTSIKVVGSTIAISYYDMVNLDLKLARSTDDGVTWSWY